MNNILITGGAGFIGFHLAKAWIEKGAKVTIVDDFSRGVSDPDLEALKQNTNLTCQTLDLRDDSAYKNLSTDFNIVYHLAARVGVQNVIDAPYKVLSDNTLLLMKMMEWANGLNGLDRFVFTSTSEIYAGTLKHHTLEFPTPEATPLTVLDIQSPRSSYMLSKIYGEAMLFQSQLPFTIVRPHNIYGPRMGLSHVIPELLKKTVQSEDKGSLDVYSVDHQRTFCYIDDAVEMMIRFATHKECLGKSFNMGSETPEVTIGEVAQTVIDTVGKNLEINPLESNSDSPVRRCPSMKLTREAIGFEGQLSLKDGIQKTFDWYNENIFKNNQISAK